MKSAAAVELTTSASKEQERAERDTTRGRDISSSPTSTTRKASTIRAASSTKRAPQCACCKRPLSAESLSIPVPSIHFFRRRDVVLSILHIFFIIFTFTPGLWMFRHSPYVIPPVMEVVENLSAEKRSELMPVDHLRFNVQWTLVIWSFYLYPCIFADLCVSAKDRSHRIKSPDMSDSERESMGCKKRFDKFGNELIRWAMSKKVVQFCGAINMILGVTTITIYSYQTYTHGGVYAIAGLNAEWSKEINFYLCVIDTIIDVVALVFSFLALFFVPISKQHLSYLTRMDNIFLVIGASSNLVYCIQVFYAKIVASSNKASGTVVAAEPDPYTLTFLRMVPITSFINWIAPRFLVTSREQWNVHRVYLQLFAACVVVAGAIMTIERVGDPDSWRPGYDDGTNGWPMFKALWFVVVTSSTVGYGDFTASTVIGRILTVVVIFTGLPKFTKYAGQIWELLLERRQGAGLIADVAGRSFIVLAGNINLRLAKLWTSQLYGDPLNSSLVVVILSRSDDGEKILEWIRFDASVKGLVYYIRGDLDDEDNLRRARLLPATTAKTCLGVFLLCNLSGRGRGVDDANNVARLQKLRTMGPLVSQHLFTGVASTDGTAMPSGNTTVSLKQETLAEQAESNSKGNLVFVNLRNCISNFNTVRMQSIRKDNIFALDQLSWALLAANIDSPGTVALISALLKKLHGTISADAHAGILGVDMSNHDEEVGIWSSGGDEISNEIGREALSQTDMWVQDYRDGYDFDLCVSDWIPKNTIGKTFATVAREAYEYCESQLNKSFRITLIGLQLRSNRETLLNPATAKISYHQHSAFVFLARSRKAFDDIYDRASNLEQSREAERLALLDKANQKHNEKEWELEKQTYLEEVSKNRRKMAARYDKKMALIEKYASMIKESIAQLRQIIMLKSQRLSKKRGQTTPSASPISQSGEEIKASLTETQRLVLVEHIKRCHDMEEVLTKLDVDSEELSVKKAEETLKQPFFHPDVSATMNKPKHSDAFPPWRTPDDLREREPVQMSSAKNLHGHIIVCGLEDEPRSFPYFLYALKSGSAARQRAKLAKDFLHKRAKEDETKIYQTELLNEHSKETIIGALSPANVKLPEHSEHGSKQLIAMETPKSYIHEPALPKEEMRSTSSLPKLRLSGNLVQTTPPFKKSVMSLDTPTSTSSALLGSVGTQIGRRDADDVFQTGQSMGIRRGMTRRQLRTEREKHERKTHLQNRERLQQDLQTMLQQNSLRYNLEEVVLVLSHMPSTAWWAQIEDIVKELSIKLSLFIGDILSPRVLHQVSASTAKHILVLPNADRAAILCTQAVENVVLSGSTWMDAHPSKKKNLVFEHITTVLQDSTVGSQFPSLETLSTDWSPSDDATLCAAVVSTNQDWKTIKNNYFAKRYVGGRKLRPWDLKSRFRLLKLVETSSNKVDPWQILPVTSNWTILEDEMLLELVNEHLLESIDSGETHQRLSKRKRSSSVYRSNQRERIQGHSFCIGEEVLCRVDANSLIYGTDNSYEFGSFELLFGRIIDKNSESGTFTVEFSTENDELIKEGTNIEHIVRTTESQNDVSKSIDQRSESLGLFADSDDASSLASLDYYDNNDNFSSAADIVTLVTSPARSVAKERADQNDQSVVVSRILGSRIREGVSRDDLILLPSSPFSGDGGEDGDESVWHTIMDHHVFTDKRVSQKPLRIEDCKERYEKLCTIEKKVLQRENIFTTPRFACGRLMISSVLQFIASTSFRNPVTISVLNKLLGSSLDNPKGTRRQLQLEDLPDSILHGKDKLVSSSIQSLHVHTHDNGDQFTEHLECAACSASFSFGTLFKNLLVRERKVVVGLYRRSSGVASLPHVILCPKFELKLKDGDRIFVIHRDETPRGRKGGREESRKRTAQLQRNLERQRWHEEEKAFNAEMNEEKELVNKGLQRINLLKAELKREEHQFSILFQHDLQTVLQTDDFHEVESKESTSATTTDKSNEGSAKSGVMRTNESIYPGAKVEGVHSGQKFHSKSNRRLSSSMWGFK